MAASFAAAPAWAADRFAEIEASVGGRLGVFAFDRAPPAFVPGFSRHAARPERPWRTISHRANERFPMCSTFKAMAVAAALKRVDAGELSLDQVVHYGSQDLLPYAPVTSKHVADGGMALGDLCAAAVELSDNTAANLILKQIGGPVGWSAFVRTLADSESRLDRNEPDLNTSVPGDPRDTTTPMGMALDLAVVLLGQSPFDYGFYGWLQSRDITPLSWMQTPLSPKSRDALAGWMVACHTGQSRLRAGLPATWRIGDKTGTGDLGTANDIAVAWTAAVPIVIACYLTGAEAASSYARDGAIADVGRLVAETFRPHG